MSRLKDHNVAVWGELNWRFHSTLCAPSGRALAMGIIQTLDSLNQRYARVQISLAKWEQRAAREQRAILAACRRKEGHKPCHLLKTHILTAGES
ncbi:MAG: FCD domain-containing protein [Candidatus Acidiferrales bacterium]